MSQFIEVLEFLDNSGQVMAQRIPQNDSGEIKYGAQLVVQENQTAIFVKDGKFLDRFGSGRHTLVTENIPFLTKLLSLPYNFRSPFRASVYFLSLSEFTNLKWGTAEPVLFRDSEFEFVRLRARGTYSIRISDPGLFIGKIVGTAGRYSVTQIEDFFRNIIVSQFFDALGANLESVVGLPAIYEELGLLVRTQVADSIARYGLELVDIKVLGVTLPDEIQRAIDERASMAAAGDLDRYVKYKAAKSIGEFAKNTGGGAGYGQAAMDVGVGVAMGQMIAGAIREGSAVPAAPLVSASAAPAPPAANQCRKCGKGHPEGAKFCMECGEKIVPAGFCGACSAQNPPAAKFCMNCGGKI